MDKIWKSRSPKMDYKNQLYMYFWWKKGKKSYNPGSIPVPGPKVLDYMWLFQQNQKFLTNIMEISLHRNLAGQKSLLLMKIKSLQLFAFALLIYKCFLQQVKSTYFWRIEKSIHLFSQILYSSQKSFVFWGPQKYVVPQNKIRGHLMNSIA